MDSPEPCDLGGLSVLVTRPAGQADRLCTAIEAANGHPVRFPTVEISASADPTAIGRLKNASDYGWLIFVSANAVEKARPYLESDVPPAIAAVGRATADALRNAGFGGVLTPPVSADSEALLALPSMTAVNGQRILIVRGNGGRPLLGDTLQLRGAQVDYAEVYRRVVPTYSPDELRSRREQVVDVTTATSGEILENLVTLLGTGSGLLERPLVVISQRVATVARELGFSRVTAAEGAGTAAVVSALCHLRDTDQLNRPLQ